ncbi:hypothetical protein [Streptomyces sp. NPDC012888]|uniref:hypothetical protein n=1 Tax=Streptomyces sp. NPDC012888 TaxID=3364855 RepID=UPI00369F8D26
MRLQVVVREEDRALMRNSTYSELCCSELHWAGVGVGDDRWRALDRALHEGLFEVSVPDTGLTVGELKDLCLREARRIGAARPESPPVSESLPEIGPVGSPERIEAVRAALEDRLHRSHVSDVWLCDAATDQRLPDRQPLAESDLAEDDLVVLCIERLPAGAYLLASPRNAEELFAWLPLAADVPAPSGGPRLWGVLLYTEADAELATYVRTHFGDLNALSGPDTRVFAVERVAGRADARRYWRQHLEPELYRVMAGVRWLRWVPHDPQGAYEVAARLGIGAERLPCLAFLHHSEEPVHQRDREKVVFPVEHPSTEYLRTLFAGIRRVLDADAVGRPPGGPRAADAAAFAALRNAEADIKETLRPLVPAKPGLSVNHSNVVILEASVSENFHFEGENTTFINRPQDTVVRDFQNKHTAAAATDDLARLLRLTLTSRDVPDEARQEASVEIHRLADLAEATEPDGPAVRTRIERLRALLGPATDIAQPALAILASLATVLGA